MSLLSSSTQPHMLLPIISNTEQTEVVDLCSPVNHTQRSKAREDHIRVGDCPSTPLSHPESEAVASPSVSAVIDALHLSDIDWEAPSFTSSPPPQVAKNHATEPRLNKSIEEDVEETEVKCTKQENSSDVRQADSRSAPELCYTECPLRDRVLMRNAAKAINQQIHDDAVSKRLNPELASVENIAPHNTISKPNPQISSKGGGDSKLTEKECEVKNTDPLSNGSQCVKKKAEKETSAFSLAAQDQQKVKDKRNHSQKPPQKYKFVRSALSSSSAPPQRIHSDPGPRDKDRDRPQTTKKSVCVSVCSSSEDSDTENRRFEPRSKSQNKIKDNDIKCIPLKPLSGSKTTKHKVKPVHCHQLGAKSQRHGTDVDVNTTPVSMKSKCQDVALATVDVDVLPLSPASPVTVLDDSVISIDSPLPLAERLRLKFLKWATMMQDDGQGHLSCVKCEQFFYDLRNYLIK